MLAVVISSGCRTAGDSDFPRIINEPAPVAESVRRDFGVVGVLPVAMTTNVQFPSPTGRTEVFQRVSGKTWNTMADTMEWRSSVGTLLDRDDDLGRWRKDDLAADGATFGFITLVSLTAGAVGAAVTGVSEERSQKCQASLRKAAEQEPLDSGIDRQLVQAAARRGSSNIRTLPEAALADVKFQNDKTDFSALAARGLDSLLDIRVTQLGFECRSGLNPELAFAPEVAVYVIRVSDGAVLHATYLNYRGERRPFTAWAEHRSRAFRSEMALAERQFAESILELYFGGDGANGR